MTEITTNTSEVHGANCTRESKTLLASTIEPLDTSEILISSITSLFEKFEREITILRIKDEIASSEKCEFLRK
jgi:hypothetical protein